VQTLQTELEESAERRDTAVAQEQKAITDLHEQVQLANEAHDK